ncbi:hypothetical protein WN48_09043 [Eufriesea mexicana]|uniref:Uncharacterized protein n=1 Tax=Eufriesea mexicana TaxID=516756 RepID=A0A310ST45_9HYME|nr:hypothetical protein WN48_09043 [Eufriesea mexicana]
MDTKTKMWSFWKFSITSNELLKFRKIKRSSLLDYERSIETEIRTIDSSATINL